MVFRSTGAAPNPSERASAHGSTVMLSVLLGLVVAVNLVFAFVFVRDLLRHRAELRSEPGSVIGQALSSVVTFFFSTFGISDFAISTVVYRRAKWVPDEKLPGTLNAQCVIPVAVMAVSYISSIEVGLVTLFTFIIAQCVGAYLGPRFVVRLPVNTIRLFIGIGLVVTSFMILAGQLGWIPSNGVATELTGWKFALGAVCMFVFGALNNVGIGSYALTMATTYALGMNPAAAFPIMMGACALSVPIGSSQFVKFGTYSRKLTLSTSTFGVLGVLVAVYVVKSLDVTVIKWVVLAVLVYTAVTILRAFALGRRAQPTAPEKEVAA